MLRVLVLCTAAYGLGATPASHWFPEPVAEIFRVWASEVDRAASMDLASHSSELAVHALKQAALIGKVIGRGSPPPAVPELEEGWHYHVEI